MDANPTTDSAPEPTSGRELHSFADVIALWESPAEMARDLTGVTDITVRSWRRRGIPGDYWQEIVDAAARRGYAGVTHELLARLGARPKAATLASATPDAGARA